MGNPGIEYPPPSGVSAPYVPPREGGRSDSPAYEGVSETTGVRDTRGGAGLEATMLNGAVLSEQVLLDWLELEYWSDGRRSSEGALSGVALGFAGAVGGAAESGAERVFLTLEKREDTRAYDD